MPAGGSATGKWRPAPSRSGLTWGSTRSASLSHWVMIAPPPVPATHEYQTAWRIPVARRSIVSSVSVDSSK
ncbi:hypothetical protein SANTM175S_06797 [Streptomyces antimycoticus]